jgi:hypothetical protein
MANIFMMNEEIARGMVCFFHQKKHFYLIVNFLKITEESPKHLGYFFPRQKLLIKFDKKVVGLHFGRLFRKLI